VLDALRCATAWRSVAREAPNDSDTDKQCRFSTHGDDTACSSATRVVGRATNRFAPTAKQWHTLSQILLRVVVVDVTCAAPNGTVPGAHELRLPKTTDQQPDRFRPEEPEGDAHDAVVTAFREEIPTIRHKTRRAAIGVDRPLSDPEPGDDSPSPVSILGARWLAVQSIVYIFLNILTTPRRSGRNRLRGRPACRAASFAWSGWRCPRGHSLSRPSQRLASHRDYDAWRTLHGEIEFACSAHGDPGKLEGSCIRLKSRMRSTSRSLRESSDPLHARYQTTQPNIPGAFHAPYEIPGASHAPYENDPRSSSNHAGRLAERCRLCHPPAG